MIYLKLANKTIVKLAYTTILAYANYADILTDNDDIICIQYTLTIGIPRIVAFLMV